MQGAYHNARVLPMKQSMALPMPGEPTPDGPYPGECSAICWDDGVIVAVGDDAKVLAEAKRRGIVSQDAEGRIVIPGFVDAHMHFLHAGIVHTRPDLRGCKNREMLFARLADWVERHPGTDPIIGEGFDEAEWQGNRALPTREELDAVSAERPLVARRMCGHVAVANSAALVAVQERFTDSEEVQPESGLLLESPSLYLNDALPSSAEQLDAALEHACRQAHALGVTAVGGYEQAPARAAMQRAAAKGTLTVRLASNIYVQQLQEEIARGMRTGRRAVGPDDAQPPASPAPAPCSEPLGGEPLPGLTGHDAPVGEGTSAWLTDGGLKVFLDGSLGGHTAYLREPYHDKPGHRGKQNWSDEALDAWFSRAHDAGIQIHAHAIGDGAIEQGLQAFERLKARCEHTGAPWDNNRLRHRFEHFEIVDDGLLARTQALGIVPCSQPNFVGVWSAKGGMYEERLGMRFGQNNRFGTYHRRGVNFCFGSDGMPFGPLYGIQAALQHPDPKQRLTPYLAIYYYTNRAAWAILREDLGSLDRGHAADLVVLNTKTLAGDAKEWAIWQTVTGGEARL